MMMPFICSYRNKNENKNKMQKSHKKIHTQNTQKLQKNDISFLTDILSGRRDDDALLLFFQKQNLA